MGGWQGSHGFPSLPSLPQAQTFAFIAGLDAWRSKNGGALPPLRDPTAVQEIVAEAREAAARFVLEGLWGAPFVLAGAYLCWGGCAAQAFS